VPGVKLNRTKVMLIFAEQRGGDSHERKAEE
jgi:hypothetical protein